jgi:hypothetical protein
VRLRTHVFSARKVNALLTVSGGADSLGVLFCGRNWNASSHVIAAALQSLHLSSCYTVKDFTDAPFFCTGDDGSEGS